jgi:hypothetical protein
MNAILEEYTIFMALQDYLPVLLSSVGLFFLSRMVARIDQDSGRLATLGWILITLGGLNKATWKLIMAATSSQTNLVWLDDSLFVLLGTGFLFMGFAIWYAQRRMQEKQLPFFKNVYIVPVTIAAVFVGLAVFMSLSQPTTRIPFYMLLGLTTVGNFVTGGLLIRQGLQQGSRLAALLFGFNLLAILMLTGMARIDPQTIPLEWAAQITNTISNAAFAFAAYKLAQLTTARAPAVNVAPQAEAV